MNYCYLYSLIKNNSIKNYIYTVINTLTNCKIILASDERFDGVDEYIHIADSTNQRMFLKYKILGAILNSKKEGDIILTSDIDVYYKTANIFDDLPEQDILVTTRHYKHKYIINAGVFFTRVNNNTRKIFGQNFINWSCGKNLDWMIDQDYLIYLYKHDLATDIGPNYNYCPDSYKVGFEKAKLDLINGFNNPEVKVLHLKSELKKCLYEGWLPKAIIKEEQNNDQWP